MSIVSKNTLKAYFDTGDTITSGAMTDLIDSGANLADGSAQAFQGEISTPSLVAAAVSASTANIATQLIASAATITGIFRQGVNTGASATTTLGYVLVSQEATVGGAATAQVAFLPTLSNIHSIKVKVLTGGSAAAGGLETRIGIPSNGAWLGSILSSAVGIFQVASVAIMGRYTGISSAIEMYNIGASANTNVIGIVQYYQRT